MWGLIKGIRDLSIIAENLGPLLVNIFILVMISNQWYKKQTVCIYFISCHAKLTELFHDSKIARMFYAVDEELVGSDHANLGADANRSRE